MVAHIAGMQDRLVTSHGTRAPGLLLLSVFSCARRARLQHCVVSTCASGRLGALVVRACALHQQHSSMAVWDSQIGNVSHIIVALCSSDAFRLSRHLSSRMYLTLCILHSPMRSPLFPMILHSPVLHRAPCLPPCQSPHSPPAVHPPPSPDLP